MKTTTNTFKSTLLTAGVLAASVVTGSVVAQDLSI